MNYKGNMRRFCLSYEQTHDFFKRQNRKKRKIAAGITVRKQGRPAKSTDISYIHTKQGVLYLSIIRDLYDNIIVAYKTGTQQTVKLVLDTIKAAKRKSHCRVAVPQRPRLSIYFPCIF